METYLNVKWNRFDSNFLNNLSKFRAKESLCDVTILCKEAYFPAHKLVLSLCSDYFDGIFSRTECKHPYIIITDIDPCHMQYLFQFMYEGIARVPKSGLTNFLKAAYALKIKGFSDPNTIDREENNTPALNLLNTSYHPKQTYGTDTLQPPQLSPKITAKASPIISPKASAIILPKAKPFIFPEVSIENINSMKDINVSPTIKIERSSKAIANKKLKLLHTGSSFQTLKGSLSYHVKEKSSNLKQSKPISALNDLAASGSGITIVSCTGNSIKTFESGQTDSLSSVVEVDKTIAVKVDPTEDHLENQSLGNCSYDARNFISTISSDVPENESSSLDIEEDPFSAISDVYVNDNVNHYINNIDNKTKDEQMTGNNYSVQCLNCSFKSPSAVDLKLHYKTAHQISTESKVWLRCKYCPYTADCVAYVQFHERCHLCEISYQCQMCYFRSSTRLSRDCHQKTHLIINCTNTKEPIKRYTRKYYKKLTLKKLKSKKILTCCSCPYIAGSKMQLKKHEKRHLTKQEDLTNLQCKICFYISESKYYVFKHEEKHKLGESLSSTETVDLSIDNHSSVDDNIIAIDADKNVGIAVTNDEDSFTSLPTTSAAVNC